MEVEEVADEFNGSTIFIAGGYGTGKSTLCSALSERFCIPAFSAGDLISEINGEQYGANKAVADKNHNQLLLIERVCELNRDNELIILAGHFCIFSSDNSIEIIPESVFFTLNIKRIILIEANIQQIIVNLRNRDGKIYSEKNISMLMEKEREQSVRISKQLKCPLDNYKMTFTDSDIECITSLLH